MSIPTCQIPGCAPAIAVGTCRKCGRGFCLSHALKDQWGQPRSECTACAGAEAAVHAKRVADERGRAKVTQAREDKERAVARDEIRRIAGLLVAAGAPGTISVLEQVTVKRPLRAPVIKYQAVRCWEVGQHEWKAPGTDTGRGTRTTVVTLDGEITSIGRHSRPPDKMCVGDITSCEVRTTNSVGEQVVSARLIGHGNSDLLESSLLPVWRAFKRVAGGNRVVFD